MALGYQFHIASSREQAIRDAAPHYEENMKMVGELRRVRALSDAQIAAMRDPLDVQLADLDRFAKDVVPAVRYTRIAVTAQ